jgi:hypothetical protein
MLARRALVATSAGALAAVAMVAGVIAAAVSAVAANQRHRALQRAPALVRQVARSRRGFGLAPMRA